MIVVAEMLDEKVRDSLSDSGHAQGGQQQNNNRNTNEKTYLSTPRRKRVE